MNKILSLNRKKTVTQKQFDELSAKAAIADLILNEKVGKPFLELINTELRSAEEKVLTNSLWDIQQEGLVNGIKSTLGFSRKQQLEELSGQYQAIKRLKETLSHWVNDFEQLNTLVRNGEVQIVE
jgi:hypothetical protein